MAFDRTVLGGERAQTSIDFIIAMSIFLIAIGFVLGYIPTIFDPFTGDSAATMVVSDRTGALLADDILGSPRTPGMANATCTTVLLGGAEFTDGEIPSDCRYDEREDFHAVIGVSETHNVNVTVENASSGEIVNVADEEITTELDATDEDVRLRRGPDPTHSTNVDISQRVIDIDGDQYRLYVRVW